MEKLTNEELVTINGGNQSMWLIIGGVILLGIAIIDGIVNPNKCNN